MRNTSLAMFVALSAICLSADAIAKQEPANDRRDHVIEYIKKHASTLNTVTLDGYLNMVSVKKTSDSPVAYLVTYETNMPSMLTLPGANHYEYNTKITKEWKSYFCTSKIKAMAKDLKIAMLAGAVIDKQGKRHSSTACY